MADRNGDEGFVDGVLAFVSGLAYVVGTPSIWTLAFVPIAVAGGLFTAAAIGAYFIVARYVVVASAPGITVNPLWNPLWRFAFFVAAPLLPVVRRIVLGLVAIAASFVAAAALAQPISGPALDRIVRRRYAALGGGALPEVPLGESIARGLRVTLVTLAASLPVLAVLTLVGFFFPPALVVTLPLKVGATAILATWNFVDYPFSLARAGVRARGAWTRAHLGASLGFGLCLVAVGLVPLVGLVVLPIGVAGATDLARRALREDGRPLRPGA